MRTLIEYRFVLSLVGAALTGVIGLQVWPFPAQNTLLALIQGQQPAVYAGFVYTYATLWFTTPFLLWSGACAFLYIFVARADRPTTRQPLPPYPAPETRDELFLILGEQHRHTVAERASVPTWLTIPERGLYTGMVIVGAIGTGKTSACMYPYVEQLLAYRADRPADKLGGLILEVKGDFCRHVRDMLARRGRADDYVEISLTSQYRYNPLHNDLDAYALAYGIATLMTNLFGKSKEPFWQQASTNLVKFVILLHKTLDDYVTLFQVYEHVINPDKLRIKIAEGEQRFAAKNRRVFVDKLTYLSQTSLRAWTWHDQAPGDRMWTHWSPDLIEVLGAHIPHQVQDLPPDADDGHRIAQ